MDDILTKPQDHHRQPKHCILHRFCATEEEKNRIYMGEMDAFRNLKMVAIELKVVSIARFLFSIWVVSDLLVHRPFLYL